MSFWLLIAMYALVGVAMLAAGFVLGVLYGRDGPRHALRRNRRVVAAREDRP